MIASSGMASDSYSGDEIHKFLVNEDGSLDDFDCETVDCAAPKAKTKDRTKYWRRLSDQPNSLLYFPHWLAHLCNSGDMEGVAELIKRHFHKKALVHISGTVSMVLTTSMYISLLAAMEVLFCDTLNCVRSTEVVGTQVHSKMYFSYTDVHSAYLYAASIIKDPSFMAAFVGKRSDILKRRLKLPIRSAEVQAKLVPLIESDQNLLIHGKIKVTIAFDQRKLKITRLDFVYSTLSVFHNGERVQLREKKKVKKDLLAEGY